MLKILIILLSFLFSSNVFAELPKCKNSFNNCIGKIKFNGGSYEGEFQNNKANGSGVMKLKNFQYTGDFINNKFEGQGKDSVNVQPPRTDYGFIDKKLLSRFEKNGFVTIDPYKYNILDVIWYIRNCNEFIISTGTAAHLYSPYVSKKTKE